MSDSATPTMSISERIAALNKQVTNNESLPALTKPVKNSNALSNKIAALQMNSEDNNINDEDTKSNKPKVGKLKKPPPGAVPIMFGAGPPSLLSKKKKEREERMEKLKQEAADETAIVAVDADGTELEKKAVGKLIKPPAGAVPIMMFGAGPPPSLLKKQKERDERIEQTNDNVDDNDVAAASTSNSDGNVDDDALLSRPTSLKGKRRPRSRA